MDGALPSVSPPDLANIIGTAAAPIVVDVRSAATWPLLIGSFRAQSIARTTMSRTAPGERYRQSGQLSSVICPAARQAGRSSETLCRFSADAETI